MLISIHLTLSSHYQRKLLLGALEFFHGRSDVELVIPDNNIVNQGPPPKVDGVMGPFFSQQMSRRLRELYDLSVPIVHMSERNTSDEIQVYGDHEAICKMALEHFRECNLPNVGFVLVDGDHNARYRMQAMERMCETQKIPFYLLDSGCSWVQPDFTDLESRLIKLPKPIGVLLPSDHYGSAFSEACGRAGQLVPQSIQVLGIDNDLELCRRNQPKLSSIDVDIEKIGFQAASMLYDRILGKEIPQVTKVEPNIVVKRETTSFESPYSAEVQRMLSFMEENLSEKIGMSDIAAEQKHSRRTLEKRFLTEVGDSPMKYLSTLRLERACYYLETSEMSITEISEICGFSNRNYFFQVFRETFRCTPAQYRRRYS